jgi:hypothetical protein
MARSKPTQDRCVFPTELESNQTCNQTIELHRRRDNRHNAAVIIAWLPKQKMLMQVRTS